MSFSTSAPWAEAYCKKQHWHETTGMSQIDPLLEVEVFFGQRGENSPPQTSVDGSCSANARRRSIAILRRKSTATLPPKKEVISE